MSTRGVDFLYRWMSENIPEHASVDPGLITDLADQAPTRSRPVSGRVR
ncbi:DUF768 domain-containing protein [Mesorhizobium sp. B2-3-13]|nr:DUF768 domain-containing protein [Mesorhizobium sp. B2-3-13]